jgi:PAS domain S-box-containing protein
MSEPNHFAGLAAPPSFRALFETAPDGMLVINAAGRIVIVNSQIERLFGYSAAELTGHPIEILLPERLRDRHVGHRSGYVHNPRTRPMGSGLGLAGLRKNGTEFPLEIALSPMHLEGGTFVVASVRDISETLRAQEALKRARFSEQLARLGQIALDVPDIDSLLAAVPAVVAEALEVDSALVYLLSADRTKFICKAAHGMTPEQAAALSTSSDARTPPGYVASARKPVIVADYATEQRFDVPPIVRSEGYVSALGVPLVIQGQVVGALTARSRRKREADPGEVLFMQSIGNIVAAAIQRNRAEEQLAHAQRLESIGQLTGGIAHDFNNLLTVISGNLQMIEDHVADNAALGKSVAAARRATARGAELTRKLLAFSRRQSLSPRAIELKPHLVNLTEMLTRTLGEHIEVVVVVEEGLPPCRADPGQLDNALLNLALNARDAMPKGGKLTIEACLREIEGEHPSFDQDAVPGTYVSIAVTDTGAGMTPEVRDRALEPFYTTKDAGKGSGLGLSMVYGFAKQSGGYLRLYSEPGRGTSVSIYLPSAEPGEVITQREGRKAERGHECILVVEDDPDVRDLAVGFLNALGYRVLEAGTAAEALNLLGEHREIDLLFSDVVLAGGSDGPELARQAQRDRPDLPVLFTTGYARGALSEMDDAHPTYDLLRKPYTREELALRIRQALDRDEP